MHRDDRSVHAEQRERRGDSHFRGTKSDVGRGATEAGPLDRGTCACEEGRLSSDMMPHLCVNECR